MRLNLIVIGFMALYSQVAILRELQAAFYGIELIYILALGIWMLWNTIGVLIPFQKNTSERLILPGLALLSVVFPGTVLLIRTLVRYWSAVPGTYLPLREQLILLVLYLLPVATLTGVLFRWAAHSLMRKNGSLPQSYALECTGGVAAGIVSALFIHMGFSNLMGIFTVSTCLLLFVGFRSTGNIFRKSVFSAALLSVLAVVSASQIDLATTRLIHPNVAAVRDTPYSRITVTQQDHQINVFENNTLTFESDATTAEELVHAAAIQRDHDLKVLILGGGYKGILEEIQKYRPISIDYVEKNGAIIEILANILPFEKSSNNHGNTAIHIADPRQFIRSAGYYDLIIIGLTHPTSGGSNRLFTTEFYRDVTEHLEPDGILAFQLTSTESNRLETILHRNASIIHAVETVFSDILILPGTNQLILASSYLLTRNTDILMKRFTDRRLETRLMSAPYIEYLYTNERGGQLTADYDGMITPANSDDRPNCYIFTIWSWLVMMSPGLDIDIPRNPGYARTLPAGFLVVLAGLILFGIFYRARIQIRAIALAMAAGFIAMVFESIVFLTYQAYCGILYQNIGVLLMCFMLGMVVGAGISHRLLTGSAALRGYFSFCKYGVCLLFAGFVMLIAWSGLPSGLFGHIVGFSGMFFCGSFVSVVFSAATEIHQMLSNGTGMRLYAADLIGGCMGSFLATVFFIPFWGMSLSGNMLLLLLPAVLVLM